MVKRIDYEGNWWERTVKVDAPFSASSSGPVDQLALEAATQYAHAVCIGNLSALRRFLETSIRNSDKPQAYLGRFLDGLLISEGRDQCLGRLRMALGLRGPGTYRSISSLLWSQSSQFLYAPAAGRQRLMTAARTAAVDKITRVILGFTRKRELLVPAWADDAGLWSGTGAGSRLCV